MRIVYVDLHTNTFFLRSLRMLIKKQRAIDKHRFILEWLLKNDIEVADYVTLSGSSIPGAFFRNITNNNFARKIEAKYVLKKNGLNVKKIAIITNPEELRADDIIIFYSHFDNTQFCMPVETKGVRVVDHIHFYGESKVAELLKKQKVDRYICEVDLKKYCPLFEKNYSWLNSEYINRPFSYQPRFKNIVPFNERKNKVVAMGTLTKCDLIEFVECYKTEYYQPHRKMIYDNSKNMENILDCYISEYQETPQLEINKNDFIFEKCYKKIKNFYTQGIQKSYFSFDMVEKYNEYKMFICPEDAIGSYGIGVIEGMACGCAMIGWNYGAYEDLGMKSGIHYISYDGTLENLKQQIEYYQKDEHQDELRLIAETGCNYVRRNFSQDIVANLYYENLKQLV